MKIYTKTGDTGNTTLVGGKKVKKFHERVEAYGTVDELVSHIGLLYDLMTEADLKNQLLFIQKKLMTCGALLASDPDEVKFELPIIYNSDIEVLERNIDEMEAQIEPLHQFIIPGGDIAVSLAHVCRTICRRAERRSVALSENYKVEPSVNVFLNRLSDYLFVLARLIAKRNNVEEIFN